MTVKIRPRQFQRIDKDVVEISLYMEEEPIIVSVIKNINPNASYDYSFRVSTALYGDNGSVLSFTAESNFFDGAIQNLMARINEHKRDNK